MNTDIHITRARRARVLRRFSTMLALAGVVAMSACTPAPTQQSQRASEAKPYDFHKEGKVPALEPEDIHPQPDVVETPLDEDSLHVQEAEAPPETSRTTPEPAKPAPGGIPAGVPTEQGFRVQVFASQSEYVAQNARSAAQERLGVPAYVDFVDGLYKVRVGDCKTRKEAEALLEHCRSKYYKDAWVVESTIVAGSSKTGG